jgi:hypothetical protein
MSIVRWNPWRESDDFFTNVAAVPSEHIALPGTTSPSR